jgi:hypothetical protein
MKKNLTIFAGVLLLMVLIGFPLSANCGDVNGDGMASIVDVLIIAQYYVGLSDQEPDPAVADVNNDGVVNILDALAIARYYVGITSSLNCPQPTPAETPSGTPVGATVRISHIGGIQCELTYFNYPTEAMQNLVGAGITVIQMNMSQVPVITLCGVPNGITFIAEIYSSDLDKALALGWSLIE